MSKAKILFPSWRYHKDLGSKLVESEAESESLGAGWVGSPADFDAIPDAGGDNKKGDDSGDKGDVVDLSDLSKKELVAAALEKGIPEEQLKGLNKDKLIELLKSA